jgi:phosphomannomutase
VSSELFAKAQTYLDNDPDPAARAELTLLVSRAQAGNAVSLADLEDRFRGFLSFGTAGLRGLLGPGESRMNRAVVIRATHGLLTHVLATVPEARSRGVVIGRDGRKMSKELQRDAAEVALALGFKVHFFEELCPTPLVAFAVKHLGAAAGVMITASHNPPAYNGYKVYWENGAQIIPPQDVAIAAAIALAPAAKDVARVSYEEGVARGVLRDASPNFEPYLEAIEKLCVVSDAPLHELVIAYSAMHGVGEKTFRRAMAQHGFTQVHSVKEQAEPDGAFPTVEFPNPEEPGALDRVLALARSVSADVVLVNDPDADRLGVAARTKNGEYVVLNGNEIGVLLGHHLLVRGKDRSDDRLVMATIVSSQLLKRVALGLGAKYAETLTGFKWIANEALRLEKVGGAKFVFGYEEALGYTIGNVVRDKDGISAALVMAELCAVLKLEGRTLLDELEHIRRTFGLLLSRQKSVTLPGREGAAKIAHAMSVFRALETKELGGVAIEAKKLVNDGEVVLFDLAGGGRIAVRPSGTEPKIKFYFEMLAPLTAGEEIEPAAERGRARLVELEKATLAVAAL